MIIRINLYLGHFIFINSHTQILKLNLKCKDNTDCHLTGKLKDINVIFYFSYIKFVKLLGNNLLLQTLPEVY